MFTKWQAVPCSNIWIDQWVFKKWQAVQYSHIWIDHWVFAEWQYVYNSGIWLDHWPQGKNLLMVEERKEEVEEPKLWEKTSTRFRHGILYNSFASKNLQSTGFHKISAIFSQFHMTFHDIDALDYILCGNPSRNRLPHHNLNNLHISFHNMRQMFRRIRCLTRFESISWIK